MLRTPKQEKLIILTDVTIVTITMRRTGEEQSWGVILEGTSLVFPRPIHISPLRLNVSGLGLVYGWSCQNCIENEDIRSAKPLTYV